MTLDQITRRPGGARWSRFRASVLHRAERLHAVILSPIAAVLGWLLAIHATRGASPGLGIERLLRRTLVAGGGCCPAGSASHGAMQVFGRVLDTIGSLRDMAALDAGSERTRLRRRLAALARVILMGQARHWGMGHLRCLLGLRTPLLLDAQIAAFPDCDLACPGCYSRPTHGGPPATRERLAWLVDEAAANGAMAIHMAGKGEPFKHRAQVAALVSVMKARPHLLFTLATSGVGLDEDLAAALGTVDNVLVLVSIDGPESHHDARRGRGARDDALRAMARLQRAGVVFGYACITTRNNAHLVTDRAFVVELAAAGCLVGVYSRYFPLAPGNVSALCLDRSATRTYLERLEAARTNGPIVLLDLDELEAKSGCRARHGLSVHIDAGSGQVAPCIRAPFSPTECRVDRSAGVSLDDALAHPFFVALRGRPTACHCGEDLEETLASVRDDLASVGPVPPELDEYIARAAVK